MKDLYLRRGFVIHSGHDVYPMGAGIFALPARLLGDPQALWRALRWPERSIG